MRTRRLSVSALAIMALVVPLLGALGPAATAAHDTTRRVAGSDRIDTALAVSADAFGAADTAIIANAYGFADALAAAPLAGAVGGPVLLNPPDELDARVKAELDRLGVTTVLLMGGTVAQSAAVANALAATGRDVERVAGSSRFDTGAEAARRAVAIWRAEGDGTAGGDAIIALGAHPGGDDRAWPDALAAGVLAGRAHRPLLLVHRDQVPQATLDAIRDLGVERVTVVGGTGAIPESTVAGLGDVEVTRLAGSNRYATAALLADAAVDAGADPSIVHVVTGRAFPDALGAVPAVLAGGGVLLLLDGRDLDYSPASRDWLRARAAEVGEAVIVGGSSAVSAGTAGQVDWALDGLGGLTLDLQEIGTFSEPLAVRSDPSLPDRLYVVERSGRIRIIDDGIALPTPFLDLQSQVRTDGERGLLDMVLAPDFVSSGRFFVHYSHASDGRTVVSEFRRSSGDHRVAQTTEYVLLEVPQPASNHNGGGMAFLPDGTLVVALGDGGGSNDQFRNGQDQTTLLGGLVRLDVATPGVAGPAAGNPYIGRGGDDRLWAIGLRNPWRISMDPVGGLLWIGDVGQGSWEEIDASPWSQGGLNYGWNTVEGNECFQASSCSTSGFTPPVEVYARSGGRCAVIGGHVHRGSIGRLRGHYLYGDLCSGEIWSLRILDGEVTERTDWSSDLGGVGSLRSFGQGGAGEVYVLSGSTVWRIVEA